MKICQDHISARCEQRILKPVPVAGLAGDVEFKQGVGNRLFHSRRLFSLFLYLSDLGRIVLPEDPDSGLPDDHEFPVE
jgi:hypothetical protein